MIKVYVDDFAPSEGKYSWIDDSIKLRSERYDVESSVRIVRMKESAFYNRLIDYSDDKRFSYKEDGTLIINAPSIFHEDRAIIKEQSECFFPAGSVIIAININFKDLGDILPAKVLGFCINNIYNIVYNRSDINTVQMSGNDLLYNGKKFYGEELGGDDNCYAITAICTCDYLKYKNEFDNLRNHGEKEITGITDEIPELTQEIIIAEILEQAQKTFQ